jgi:hypothetical protein
MKAMNQFGRWCYIFIAAEVAAFNIALGVVQSSGLDLFIGLNCAFIAAGYMVYDHEQRGKSK